MEVLRGDLYDYPLYYDLVFGSDYQAEMKFLEQCFRRFVSGDCNSLFEPACGTGRLLYRLAKRGYRVSGLDLNERAVAFCNGRLKKLGFPASVFVGDMADFQVGRASSPAITKGMEQKAGEDARPTLKKPVDAAFNTINSFRHLQTEESAKAHLECMAAAVRPGGIYVLGLHLSPTRGTPIETESWEARRGQLTVQTHMWTVSRDLKKRREVCGMTIDAYSRRKSLRIEDEIVFRTYTAPQMLKLLASVPQWRNAAMFDFSYNIHREAKLDDRTEDVVFILERV